MSFKREGNDTGLLSVLRKRRINDLLTEDIPEDEAKLLANGRFTCLVCSSHPIFDTVNMLSVHRKGKKHKGNAEYHERKKAELRQLIAKRKHDQFLATGSAAIDVATSQYKGVSSSTPYDPRVKRSKVQPGERKQRIILQCNGGDGDDESMEEFSSSSRAKIETNLQQRAPLWQTICDKQQLGPVKHDAQLKNIIRENEKSNVPLRLNPYCSSKHRKYDSNSTTKKKLDVIINDNGKLATPSVVRSNTHDNNIANKSHSHHNSSNRCNSYNQNDSELSKLKRTPISSGVSSSSRSSCSIASSQLPPHSHYPPSLSSICNPLPPPSSKCNLLPPPPPPPPSSFNTASSKSKCNLLPPPPPSPSLPPKCNKKESLTLSSAPPLSSKQNSAVQTSLALKYHQLQGSGWKKDWDGKWIKDEQAEFDSDEEPPDLP